MIESECKVCEGKKSVVNPITQKEVTCAACITDADWARFYAQRDPYKHGLEKMEAYEAQQYLWENYGAG